MSTYWFDIEVSGPVTEDHIEALGDIMADAGEIAGRGGFPAPKVPRPRASLYSWAEVSAWLESARLGEADHAAAETARACALFSAALTVRAGMRQLPAHDRPYLARLVA